MNAKTEIRIDDWANTMASLGGINDKTQGQRFVWRRRLMTPELNAMYVQNGIIARIVDLKAREAFRTPWRITEIDVEIDHAQLKSDMDDLKVDHAIRRAWQWANLHGGAGIALPVVDGAMPHEPLQLHTAERLFPLQVLSAENLLPLEMDVAFGSKTHQQILSYLATGLSGQPVHVHASRIIPVEPIELPLDTASRFLYGNNGWGPSVIERVYDAFMNSGASKQHSVAMMYIASILHIKINGFRKTHTTDGGKEQLRKFLSDVRANLDSLGILGLDKEDEIGATTLALSGVDGLIDRLDNALVAVAEMPREILLNESPAGLNAGQLSGPQEIWFAKVQAHREQDINPMLDRVLELYFAIKKIPATTWTIEWDPLWTRSEGEQADIGQKNATTARIMFDMGAADAEEIRQHYLIDGNQTPLRVPDPADDAASPGFDLPAEVAAETQALAAPQSPTSGSLESASPSPADQALSGAQIATMLEIVEKIQAGAIPRDAAIGIIGAAFPMLRGHEASVLGSAGLGAPAPAPAAAVPIAVEPTDEPAPTAYAPPAGETLMTAQEIQASVGVSPATLKSMRLRGEIGAWQFGPRWKYAQSEVLQAAHRPAKGETPGPEGAGVEVEPSDDQ